MLKEIGRWEEPSNQCYVATFPLNVLIVKIQRKKILALKRKEMSSVALKEVNLLKTQQNLIAKPLHQKT